MRLTISSALLTVTACLALLGGVGTASAATLKFAGSYTSATACQTRGNTLAQQGKLTSFSCQYVGGTQGWLLWIW
ncbi:hypothetical protein [Streptomyces zaomyceticus]|uniref:hypothetical protein n=1 Tax=Streptomyces zaomyceticus TaxID=68286 RepID=UPI0036BE693B